MTATIEIPPHLIDSLEDLENVRDLSAVSVRQGDATYSDLSELGAVSQTLFMSDLEELKVLCIRWGAYFEARRELREFVQYRVMQDKDTGEWQVTWELDDKVNDACVEFCNSHGLTAVLNSCLKQTNLIFSNIENLSYDMDYFEDEGNEDSGHVVIRLEVRTDQDTMLDEYDRWVDWFIDNLSATNRTLFTLTVSRI